MACSFATGADEGTDDRPGHASCTRGPDGIKDVPLGIRARSAPEDLLAGGHGVDDHDSFFALDVANFEDDRCPVRATIMVNPSPRSHTRSGL